MNGLTEQKQPREQPDGAEIPIGVPLSWPLLDEHGLVLMRAGTIIVSEADRSFLLEHFRLYKGTLGENSTGLPDAAASSRSEPLTLADMHLSIGAPVGVRGQTSMSAPMRPSRVIGFSPNHALFVMPPGLARHPTTLAEGENVQAVAIGAQGIFSFVCTVEAVCHHPFDYLVLSPPGAIRKLRERKDLRVRTRLLVGYSTDRDVNTVEGLGMGCDLSVQGMSLVAPKVIGNPATRVRVSFPVVTQNLDVQFMTDATVRNVRRANGTAGLVTHGLEFDDLGCEKQFALSSFILDRMVADLH